MTLPSSCCAMASTNPAVRKCASGSVAGDLWAGQVEARTKSQTAVTICHTLRLHLRSPSSHRLAPQTKTGSLRMSCQWRRQDATSRSRQMWRRRRTPPKTARPVRFNFLIMVPSKANLYSLGVTTPSPLISFKKKLSVSSIYLAGKTERTRQRLSDGGLGMGHVQEPLQVK